MDGSSVIGIEKVLKQFVKSKTLTEDAFKYMSLIVNEDCPKNSVELVSLIGDFMTDGMAYSEEDARRQCEIMMKVLID